MTTRKPYVVPAPDDLTLGQLMGIKAATGIDPLMPESAAHGIAACLWYAAREDKLTFADCLQLRQNVDFVLAEPPAEPDTDPLDPATADAETDPTSGSDTPSVS